MKAAELWDRTVSLLYPPRCVLCGAVVEYEELWCGGCPLEVLPFSAAAGGELPAITSRLPYAGGVRQAVLTLKRQQHKRVVRFFAGHMAQAVAARWAEPFALAVPVPASPAQLKKRGHNQAWLLAEELAAILGCPAAPDILQRRDDVEAQHSLSAAARRENARRAYAPLSTGAVRAKRVLLVDDVFTTGATLAACATILRQAGAEEVCGVTAAYTPLSRS